MRRLDAETGLRVLEVLVKAHPRHIAVGVLWQANDKILGKSVFDLPPVFELGHVHNEADEIAEQVKEARRKMLFTGGTEMPGLGSISEVHEAKGTGRRGNWRRYGNVERPH